jgi:DNA recombination protein RmuC
MGFRTLSIQKQSSEVWKTLGMVKTEFAKFGESLDAVKKSLEAASKKMDGVSVRSRAVERSLRKVEELPGTIPVDPVSDLLPISGDADVSDEESQSAD